MNRFFNLIAQAAVVQAGLLSLAAAAEKAPGKLPDVNAEKYTFLLFQRDNGAATQAMVATLKQRLATEVAPADMAVINVNDPAEKQTVARYGVSRAPLPLVVAVAPNGAITGMFPKQVTAAQIAGAFVSPAMADSMKAMQQGKLVVVCINTPTDDDIPAGVRDFWEDPEFSNRTEVIAIASDDATEADFLKQLKVDPAKSGVSVAFLAPPAVLVGKYGANVTKAEMAQALHAAGKCCDDPNCKHNHNHQKAKATKQPAAQSRQATQDPAGRRN